MSALVGIQRISGVIENIQSRKEKLIGFRDIPWWCLPKLQWNIDKKIISSLNITNNKLKKYISEAKEGFGTIYENEMLMYNVFNFMDYYNKEKVITFYIEHGKGYSEYYLSSSIYINIFDKIQYNISFINKNADINIELESISFDENEIDINKLMEIMKNVIELTVYLKTIRGTWYYLHRFQFKSTNDLWKFLRSFNSHEELVVFTLNNYPSALKEYKENYTEFIWKKYKI